MESRIIGQRAFKFACRIVKLCEVLWTQGPAARKIAHQLFDSGTSIGANAAESQGGQTKPDFTARLAVARKVRLRPMLSRKSGLRGSWTRRNNSEQ